MKRLLRSNNRTLEYELVQTDRHDLSIKVTKDGARLFAPRRAKLRVCDAFVTEQFDWIMKTRARLIDYDAKFACEHPLEDGARIMYLGELIKLDVKKADKVSIWQSDDTLFIETPNFNRDYLRELIKNYLSDKARSAFDSSIEKYASLVGRYPKNVRLREQKTRWGSCSSEGNINLNWKLIMAPAKSLDYVVAHELCHLYELNHSRMFWRRVKSVMPDYEYWKKWLKDNGSALGL